jgi:cytochrome P450
MTTTEDFQLTARLLLPSDVDPYDTYAECRVRGPIRHGLGSGFILSSFADVLAVLRDDRFGQLGDGGVRPAKAHPVLSFLAADPPDHERLRGPISGLFAPPVVKELRSTMERILDDIFEGTEPGTPVDLVGEIGDRFVVETIAEILGVPEEYRAKLRAWSTTMWVLLEPPTNPETVEVANAAVAEARALFSELAERRRAEPSDTDIIGILTAAVDRGDLTADELTSVCITIMVAGQETTVNLVSNGTMALFDNPDRLAELAADPGSVKRAVEELLRFDSPIQILARVAGAPVDVGDAHFEAGDIAIVLLGAANRDEAVFAHADRLDFGRPNAKRHIGFGSGLHLCLGAFLARNQAELVFSRLAGLGGLELAGEAVRRPTSMLRGYERLPISYTSR